jgi:hypothetical protein
MQKPTDLAAAAQRDVLAKYLAELPRAAHAHGPSETIRTDDYKGHQIVIKTTYEILVDGRPLAGHLGVANDGRLNNHALPNFVFSSAVEMVRRLIDSFPGDFPHQHPHEPNNTADHRPNETHDEAGHHSGDR